MDDLVGIAAQQKMAGVLQHLQHQAQLHRGEVLHLVDHHKVVLRLGGFHPRLGHQVQVVQATVGQPLAVFVEQVVQRVALGRGKQALAHAQRQVLGAGQYTLGGGGQHAPDFLERLVGIQALEALALAHALEPAHKVAPGGLAPGGHAYRFQQLAVRHEHRVLVRRVVCMRVVQPACMLGQVG